jgi:hypothetical protein
MRAFLARLLPLSRGAAAGVALALLMAPQGVQAQVGHLPERSPYEDFKIGQSVSIMGGWLAVKRDPADVAPNASFYGQLRYDVGVGGPASLSVRYMGAPSTRNVLVPSNPRDTRVISTPSVTTHLLDAGLDIALTGRKTWRRLLPSVNGGVGVVSDFSPADTGAYRFGTKFAFNYGLSVRYIARKGPQVRVDLTNFLWQYQYPDRYFVVANDTTSVLTDTRNREAWRGNWGLSAGVTLPLFR